MTGLVLVGVGGALGALCRHLLDVVMRRRGGPIGPSYGVLAANLLGSAVLGVVIGWSTGHTLDADVRRFVVAGFLGAFTTFSTLMMELVNLAEGSGDHQGAGPALAWALVSVVGGVGAAAVGWTLGTGL
ncbi:MAG: CrcB family protein [Acidimicrobiales bacterium]|nr:CrcB family protein [Acidimicrobiales bacterium]